jgi:hypothetical protein
LELRKRREEICEEVPGGSMGRGVSTGCEVDGDANISLVFKTSRGVVTAAENAPDMDPQRAAS